MLILVLTVDLVSSSSVFENIVLFFNKIVGRDCLSLLAPVIGHFTRNPRISYYRAPRPVPVYGIRHHSHRANTELVGFATSKRGIWTKIQHCSAAAATTTTASAATAADC